MKKFFYLVAASLLTSFLLISCSSASAENGEVSLMISKDAVSRMAARAGDSTAQSDFKVKVKLTAGDYVNEQTTDLDSEKAKAEIKFSQITTGVSAKVEAWLLSGEEVFASGASDPFTVTSGNNPVTIKFAVNSQNGTITVTPTKKHYEIRLTGIADGGLHTDSGSFTFSIFDENGNDVLENIDWTKGDGQGNYANASIWTCVLELRKGNNVIPFNDPNVSDHKYWELDDCARGKIIIDDLADYSDGTYFITITLSHLADYFYPSSGDPIPLPDFETTSATFEIQVLPSV